MNRITKTHQAGFTLIELLLVIGLMSIIGALTTINLIKPQTAATLGSTVNQLTADLRTQQLKAMSGDTDGGSSAQTYGIHVSSNQYTLFTGSYAAGTPSNFVITPQTGVQLSTTLPGGIVTFTKASGEVTSFIAGSNTITLTNTFSGESQVITLNKLGSVSIN